MNPKPRKWWIAAFLSLLVPGFGQTYNSQLRKGLVFFAIGVGLVLLTSILLLNGASPRWLIFITDFYRLLVAAEAAYQARRIDLGNFDTGVQSRAYMKFLTIFACVVLLPVLTYKFLFQAFRIPSGAMENTFLIGDHILINKYLYGIRMPFSSNRIWKRQDIKRGDIIVFEAPSTAILSKTERDNHVHKDFIKRVIALAGDELQIKDKRVFVNGQPLNEPYVIYLDSHTYPGSTGIVPSDGYQRAWEAGEFAQYKREEVGDNFGPVQVPPDSYFVLGDNRDGSFDSRFWGPVPSGLIKGMATRIYFPSNRARRL